MPWHHLKNLALANFPALPSLLEIRHFDCSEALETIAASIKINQEMFFLCKKWRFKKSLDSDLDNLRLTFYFRRLGFYRSLNWVSLTLLVNELNPKAFRFTIRKIQLTWRIEISFRVNLILELNLYRDRVSTDWQGYSKMIIQIPLQNLVSPGTLFISITILQRNDRDFFLPKMLLPCEKKRYCLHF